MSAAAAPSTAELTSQAPWAATLTPGQLARVVQHTRDSLHATGEPIVRIGDASSAWIGVADGLLKASTVSRGGRAVMFTGVPPGGWIGEGTVLKGHSWRYDIVAMRPTRVLHVPRVDFLALLAESLPFSHYMMAHLNERLGQYIAMVELHRVTDPATRLARSIGVLFNPVLYPRMGPLLPVSQEELGELAGLTRQRTNAAIRTLEAAGLVRAEYRSLRILDLKGLLNVDEA